MCLYFSTESCDSKKIESSFCVDKYELSGEETRDFCLGWKPLTCSLKEVLLPTAEAWVFTSALDIWGMPTAGEYDVYGGGGYIANLDVNYVVSLFCIFNHFYK